MGLLWLILLGLVIGTLGTLIGAGGGFILVPILLLLYPNTSPEAITAISLGVVFFNAASGSIAYGKMGRIDYRSGWVFAAVTVPGAILGVFTTNMMPRAAFDMVFGGLMVAASLYLIAKNSKANNQQVKTKTRWTMTRKIIEKNGTEHNFSYDLRPGIAISAGVGYISSLLGIGGGIIHVPALNRLLNFPVHLATATSHFILAIMALVGTAVHFYIGALDAGGLYKMLSISAGAVVGAQIGARLARYVKGGWIIRVLALALGVVGLRIVISALTQP